MEDFAVVTGGARNIGAAIARRLSQDGFGIIVIDRIEPDHTHVDAFVQADLSDVRKLADVLAPVFAGRRITRLVNNAGIVCPALLEDTTIDDMERVLAVNVEAAMVCAQAALPAMKQAGSGRIVNISSRAALGKEKRTAYAASKAALIGMTKTWALELAAFGITVNAVAPGPIRTSLFDQANPPDSPATRAIVEGIPVGFMGEPDDVADAVSFFTSDRARFVTGQVLYVCGGMTVGDA